MYIILARLGLTLFLLSVSYLIFEGTKRNLLDARQWQVDRTGDEFVVDLPEMLHVVVRDELGEFGFAVGWVTNAQARRKNFMKFSAYPDLRDAEEVISRDHSAMHLNCPRGEERESSFHYAVGLAASSEIYYIVGNDRGGWSPVSYLRLPDCSNKECVYALYGDMGDLDGQTIPALQALAAAKKIDAVMHIGDMAYDLDSDCGRVGDNFHRHISGISRSIPYMVGTGNHEFRNDFHEFRHRYGHLGKGNSALPNDAMFYSFDIGLVHFVMLDTEVFFFPAEQHTRYDRQTKEAEWLEEDLATVDRGKTPWVVVMGHRPIYCTGWKNCGGQAELIRRQWEPLFLKYKVDFYVCGHNHHYERSFDIVQGNTTKSTHSPPGPSYIVTGAAGQAEGHLGFYLPTQPWTAKRVKEFGFSRLRVTNATHLTWEFVMADTEHLDRWMSVVDSVTISKAPPPTGSALPTLSSFFRRGVEEGGVEGAGASEFVAEPESRSIVIQ